MVHSYYVCWLPPDPRPSSTPQRLQSKEVDVARGLSSWTPNHLPLFPLNTSKQRHGQDWIWWPSSSVIRFAESSDGRRLQTVRQQLTPSNDNRTTRRISPVLSFILKFRIPPKSKDSHRNSSTRRSFWNWMTGSRWKRRSAARSSSSSCFRTAEILPPRSLPRTTESPPHPQTFLLDGAHSIQQRLRWIFPSGLFHPHSSAHRTLFKFRWLFFLEVCSIVRAADHPTEANSSTPTHIHRLAKVPARCTQSGGSTRSADTTSAATVSSRRCPAADLLCALVNEERVALRPQRVGHKSTDTGQDPPSLPQDGQLLGGQQAAVGHVVIRERHALRLLHNAAGPDPGRRRHRLPGYPRLLPLDPSSPRCSRSADATSCWVWWP